MKKIISILLLLAIFLPSTCVYASENDVELPEGAVWIENNEYTQTIAATEEVKDVEQFLKELDDYFDKKDKIHKAMCFSSRNFTSFNLSDSNTTEISSKVAYASVKFSSTVVEEIPGRCDLSGKSTAYFQGIYGHTCPSITLEDTFNFKGIGINISIPPIATLSLKDNCVVLKSSEDNTLAVVNNYNGITCMGSNIYVKQITTGSFKYGGANYFVVASDGNLF